MSGYTDRASALEAVIALTPDVGDALDALRFLTSPAVDPPARLRRANLRRALDACAIGELSPDLVERWAEALHSADDVEFDLRDRDFLAEALFELSTPELFGSMEDIVTGLRYRDRAPGGGSDSNGYDFTAASFQVREDSVMAKGIDPAVRERAVRLVRAHRSEYLPLAAAAVARQERLGPEAACRWALQAEIDLGDRAGTSSGGSIEIRALKAKVRRYEDDNATLRAVPERGFLDGDCCNFG